MRIRRASSKAAVIWQALTVPTPLLEIILDNRTRIIEYPQILENAKRNPSATPEVLRLAQEIETEFLGSKRK